MMYLSGHDRSQILLLPEVVDDYERYDKKTQGGDLARAVNATRPGDHSFRATGITAYLKNGSTLKKVAAMANHASTRTTQLYDRPATRSASMRSSGSRFGDRDRGKRANPDTS